MRRSSPLHLSLILCLFAPLLNAQTPEDTGAVEAKLKSIYEGNAVTVRGFYSNSVLDYDQSGALTSKSLSGPWTLDGKVRVDSVNLKSGNEKLVFECSRIAVGFSDDGSKSYGTQEKVQLNIKVGAPFHAAEVVAALSNVFMKKGETMADLVPDYWKSYFGESPKPVPPTPGSTPKQRIRVSSGVAAGNLVKQVPPHYPEIAKAYRQSGTVVMKANIGEDGALNSLSIVKPAGMGLDEAAVDAVKQWRYKPYLLNGVPVEVETQITVHFSLGN